MFEPYRPRRLTAQEEKDERERNYERRQRQRDRKVAGYERQAACVLPSLSPPDAI